MTDRQTDRLLGGDVEEVDAGVVALGELSSAEDDATQQLIDVRLLVCDTLHQRHQQLQTHRDHSVAEPKIRAALFISEELGLTRDHTVSFITLSINCCINVLFTPAYVSHRSGASRQY